MIAEALTVAVTVACPSGYEPVRSEHAPALAPTVCVRREVLCDRRCRDRRRAQRVLRSCRRGNMRACIRHAARRYRVSEALLLRLAWCESRMHPEAYNPSGASGLFQFLPSTWRTTPYARHWIFSGQHNALAAAWMIRQGRLNEWVCA